MACETPPQYLYLGLYLYSYMQCRLLCIMFGPPKMKLLPTHSYANTCIHVGTLTSTIYVMSMPGRKSVLNNYLSMSEFVRSSKETSPKNGQSATDSRRRYGLNSLRIDLGSSDIPNFPGKEVPSSGFYTEVLANVCRWCALALAVFWLCP